jgi:hypothetical protein
LNKANSNQENFMRHALFAVVVFASILFLSFYTSPARAADAKPDDEGFIRDWLMLAPAPITDSGADEIDKKQIPEEAALQPKAGE